MLAKFSAVLTHSFRLSWTYRLNFVGNYASNLLSVVLFYFIDQMTQQAGLRVVDGSYFTFLVIGGAFSIYLSLFMETLGKNIQEELLVGNVEPLLVTATVPVWVLISSSAWPLLEGTVIFFLKFFVAALFGADFSQANWFSAVVFTLISIIPLLSYGILSIAFTIVLKRGDPINYALRTISYIFAGIYFPITIFPPALQLISYLLPFTFAIRGLRGALMQGASLPMLVPDMLALLTFSAILLPLSLASLHYALRYARRTGNLGHY